MKALMSLLKKYARSVWNIFFHLVRSGKVLLNFLIMTTCPSGYYSTTTATNVD